MQAFFAIITLLLSFAASALALVVPAHVRAIRHQQRSLQDTLFPSYHTYSSGFTTASGVSVPGVSKVDLSDSALNVEKLTSGTTHNVVKQEGKTAWEAVYPKGSWNPSHTPRGGFGFYVGGSDEFAKAIKKGANEVIFSYSVFFEDGFEFNKGGKLPGGFGGEGSEAFGCSGGRQDERDKCFSLRLMWRSEGAGELYTYLPLTSANAAAAKAVTTGKTIENSDYGFSVGRGAFTFPTGEWVTVTERIKLNDVGKKNGQVRLWVNGASAIELYNVSLRESEDSIIQGMEFQTFFGGSTSEWASPKTQKVWFADVSGAVIETTS